MLKLFAFSKLFETIAENCLNIRSLVIDFLPEDYNDGEPIDDIEVKDLGWITSFERLEKLTIKCNVSSMSGSWHGVLKEKCFFCKKMLNLKEFILHGRGAFADATFLTHLHEAFPQLETFSMNGNMKLSDLGKRMSECHFDHYTFYDAIWPRDKFIDVLKSLARVKNLKLSNLNIKVEGGPSNSFGIDRYDSSTCYYEFQMAVEIIRKQFPLNTGLFQIQDDQEYGHCIVKKEMTKPVLRGEEWPGEPLDSCDSFDTDDSYSIFGKTALVNLNFTAVDKGQLNSE